MLALGIKGGPVVSSEPEPAADPEPEPVVQTPEVRAIVILLSMYCK